MANYDLSFPGAAIDAILTTAYDLQNAGYIFKGSATAYSGTPTQRTWLLAPAGFSGYGFSSAIPKGSIGICKWNGSAWSGDLINVVTIDNYPTYGSTNAVTSGGMWNALDDLGDGIWATLQSFVIQDGTASANQGTQIKFDVKMTDGQQVQHLISSFGILAATTTKAGLMSAADKAKVDAFLDNLRSLSFTDTTPGADVGTKIVETLKMTVGGVQEAITALTILAATTSKAGLMSATDKAYIDGLPTSLSTISTSISKLLAMLGYYECSTAAATAAKEVSASGYVLTNGGCIRIKMTNTNTADNVTLNINSTGAKALYYDGAQASASNTWEAGEVLEVYYDGTQYQCASGGGGKFATGQHVKDVSIEETPTVGHNDAIVSSDGLANILFVTKVQHDVDHTVTRTLTTRVAFDANINDGYEISFSCNDGYLASCFTTNSAHSQVIEQFCDYVSSFSMKYQGGPAYFRILIKKSDGSNITTDEAIANVSASIKYFTYQPGGLVSDVEYCKENVAFSDEESITPVLTNGYIDSNGVLQTISSSAYRYTQLIPVVKGMVISTKVCGNGTIVIGAYSGNNMDVAIVDKSVIGDNTVQALEYTVPIGVDYVRVSFRNNDVPDFYIKKVINEKVKQSIVRIDEEIDDIKDEITDIEAGLSMRFDAVEIYAGKSYYNGSLINTGDGRVGKFNLSGIEKLYVTTSWLSASAGFYMITFFDSSDNILSQLYPNTANVELTLDKQEVAIPTGASYMYVNSRYVSNYPQAYKELDLSELQEQIAEQQKEISILFIGNSLTQDAVAYVPYLLKTLNPDLRYKFYMWYCGGYNLTQQLEKITNDQVCEIFSVCEGGISWDNKNSSVKMSQILSTYKFDIVCLQEYFNYRTEPDISAFNGIVEYIENNYQYPFKVVELLHAPKRSSAQSIFNDTVAGNGLILKSTVCESIIPSGIAIYRALSTDLDSLGDQGHLSPDGTHAQEGLPCMLEAYVTALWIFDKLGIQMSVNNCSAVVDNSNYATINVPGPNLGTGVVVGTTAQVRLAQKVAIMAFKEGQYIINSNLTEYTAT